MGTVLIPKTKLPVFGVFAGMLLAGAPLAAQESSAPPSDIGPSELSNFSLNGSVTRPADPTPTPAPATPAPTTAQPQSQPSTATPIETARQAVERAERQTEAAREILTRPPTLPDARPQASATPVAQPGFNAPSSPLPESGESFSILPWLAALLFAIGAGAVFYFVRGKRTERYATAEGVDFERVLAPEPAQRTPVSAPVPAQRRPEPPPRVAPQPRHDPVPPRRESDGNVTTGNVTTRKPLPTTLMPKPAVAPPDILVPPAAKEEPAAPPADGGGIVSTSLRPWIEVELSAERAMIDDDGAAIAFDVVLSNAGSAPARDVTVETQLLNAGVQQDVELSAFFGTSERASDPIPIIAPYSRISLRSAVRIPRDKIREYEVEGRKLFMPMVAVSTRYRWSSGEGQTGAGFLVGKGQESADRLAPLRIDQGSKSWKGLGVRRYEKGLRR